MFSSLIALAATFLILESALLLSATGAYFLSADIAYLGVLVWTLAFAGGFILDRASAPPEANQRWHEGPLVNNAGQPGLR